jgi:hypothetical protein
MDKGSCNYKHTTLGQMASKSETKEKTSAARLDFVSCLEIISLTKSLVAFFVGNGNIKLLICIFFVICNPNAENSWRVVARPVD